MKRHNVNAARRPMAGKRRYIYKGSLAMLVLIILGCATAPKPVIIKHQNAPYQGSTSVSRTQSQKDTADEGSAALLDLLKKKKVISADEADRFIKEKGTATSSEDVEALVELLKKKNVVSADEAARFVKQSGNPASTEKVTAAASKITSKEQNEKVPASSSVEIKKDIPEPVIKDEQRDVPPDTAKSNKEQSEETPASVNEELKNDPPDQVKRDEQKEDPQEAVKDDEEQSGKTPESVSEELKEDSPEAVKNDEQKDVTPEVTTRIDDAQVDEIMDGVKEELKSDIHEQVYNQVKEMLRTDISDLPDWVRGIRFEGDVRLRYQHDQFDQNNGTYARPDNWQQMNTTTSHDYFRYRARVGVTVPVNNKVETILRLSTGNDTNPTSTNSTMGDYMNRDRVYFDLAYLKLQPWSFLTFEGGRIPNPWFYSDLVWSPNLNFEGVALKLKKSISETLTAFLTVGAFPLQQDDFFSHSKYLAAGQLGLEKKQPKGISAKIGAAYYDFNNITGEVNTTAYPNLNDWTAPLYQQKGNTLFNIAVSGTKTALASEFKELNVTANLDIGFWDPVHVVFLGDYVRNLGFDMPDVVQRTGFPNDGDIDGYQIGVSVGYPKIQEFGQWKAYLYYKYLGADAVIDAYTDSDFHLGGTDAKGWIFGAEFGLWKNTWLSTRWLTANEIHGNQGDQFGLPLAIDVLQVDLNVRF